MTTTHKVNATVRTFNLTANNEPLPALRADLQARGFDGTVWHGVTVPQGKCKQFSALFYRSVKSGTFQHIALFSVQRAEALIAKANG